MFAIHDGRLKRELIKTKYVCLTVLLYLPSPLRAVEESLGATYHAGTL